jgi:hypothetical protein
MKPGKADFVRSHLFFPFVFLVLLLLAAVPAYCQRGTLDLNVGQTADQFGALPRVTSGVVDLTGELTIKKPNPKKGGPSIVAGGEIRVPSDTNNHSKEYAVYGGVAFATHNLSIGFNGEVRKIIMPTANVNGQLVTRYNMELLELPVVIRYRFGPGKGAFIEAQGEPEFTPHFKTNVQTLILTPHPLFDHGYKLRGSVGYNFGQWWYVKGTYETRYFKFNNNNGSDPSGIYDWKSNMITGGIGVRF